MNVSWSARYRALVLLCAGCVLLAGCGFHLRGAARLPDVLSATHITGLNQNDELVIDLGRQLKANGIKLVEQDQAQAVLRIVRKQQGRRVLAVDSQGKVREYELYMQVVFEVKGHDSEYFLENQTINLTRDFLFDQDDVLGKAAEQDLIFDEIRSDVVRLIIYRLQTINKSNS